MNKEKELDMNELIESFGECSTDYTKTACTYYANYLEEYQKEKIRLEQQNKELHNKIEKAIEFIKKAQYDDELKSYVYGLNATGTRKLLEILKDSNVNE